MQLRNGPNQLGVLGLIGAFGGKIEADEKPEEAARREVNEETNLGLTEDDLRQLGEVEVISELEGVPITVRSRVFVADIDQDADIEASEGTLVSLTREEALERLEELTPATRAAFKDLM